MFTTDPTFSHPFAALFKGASSATLMLGMAFGLSACAVAEAQTGQPIEESDASQEQTQSTPTRQCFFARQVNGFRNVEDAEGRRIDTRVLIDVGASDTYEFELLRRCPALRFARSIALQRTGPGRICDGLDVDLIVNDTLSPEKCRVTMVRKLDSDDPSSRAGARRSEGD
ncbi:MAG: DUF6491 family protein [Erythrobacter sp.]